MIISDITPELFNELYLKHSNKLSCPCSTIAIPYKNFVRNKITYHPVCSSIFVSNQWVDALYLSNATRYVPTDFRSIASAQVSNLQRDSIDQQW